MTDTTPADLIRPHAATSRSRVVTAALAVLLTAGVALRVLQYLPDSALRLDEIAVARNIIEMGLGDLLTRPLKFDQSAPKGFLAAEKSMVFLAGTSEHSLRTWSFAASLVSLMAFSGLAIRLLDPVGAVAAVAAFAFAAPLIRQTAQVKQYTTDVAVAAMLMLLTLPNIRRTSRFDLFAGLAGAVAIWFSQPAVLVASAMVLILASETWAWRSDAARRLDSIWRITCWTLSAGAATLVAMQSMTPHTDEYMHRYWALGFPPPVWQAIRTVWPWSAYVQMFGEGTPGFRSTLVYPLPAIYAVLSLLGLVSLVRRRSGWVVTLPVVGAVAAAVMHQYPFLDRLILFLLPSLLVALGHAVSTVHRLSARVRPELAAGVTTLLVAGTMYPVMAIRPPYTIEDIKPVMSALRAQREPGDAIYVHWTGAPAFEYYASRYGIDHGSYTVGSCYFSNGQAFLNELDTFRGRRRVWVVMTHIIPPLARERLDLLAYFDAIGHRRAEIVVPSWQVIGPPLPAEAVLFDLSDGERLANTNPNQFSTQSPYHLSAGCSEGPESMAAGTL